MIIRYIILILVLYLLYRLIKILFKQSSPEKRLRGEAEEMVLDRNCGRYILKNSALRLFSDGNNLFFCSRECLEDFEKKAKNK